jgi:hypothetical protein
MHRRRLIVPSLLLTLAIASISRPSWSAGHVEYFTLDAGGNVARGLPTQICPSYDPFSNQDPSFTLNSVPQNGDEWAEDIHFAGGGDLIGFGVGFYGVVSDSFDVTITLYEWNGDNVAPGSIILGPFTLRVPFNTIGVGVGFNPGIVKVGPDLWLSAQFSDPAVGLWLHDPPQAGLSHDLYWNVTTGMQEQLGGGTVANFVSSISLCRLKAAISRE